MNYSNFDVRLRVNPRKERDPRRQESARKGAGPSGASSRQVPPVREPARKAIVRPTLMALAALLSVSFLHATTVSLSQPTANRWMYPFASNPGNEASAAVFGDVGDTSGSFDERDGQMLLGFNLSGLVATGLGASSYQINSVTITLTLSNSSYLYDPTYDSYQTYLNSSASGDVADSDAGRPVELFGVGIRNGYTAQSFTETSPFGTTARGGRNAYAMSYLNGTATDVSNNVSGGFESSPWAVGTTSAVNPGDAVPRDDPLLRARSHESLRPRLSPVGVQPWHAGFHRSPPFPWPRSPGRAARRATRVSTPRSRSSARRRPFPLITRSCPSPPRCSWSSPARES
ncbi:MAG: hypothetical protein QM796_06275 [Chthoniobacteraceae bacterium]